MRLNSTIFGTADRAVIDLEAGVGEAFGIAERHQQSVVGRELADRVVEVGGAEQVVVLVDVDAMPPCHRTRRSTFAPRRAKLRPIWPLWSNGRGASWDPLPAPVPAAAVGATPYAFPYSPSCALSLV